MTPLALAPCVALLISNPPAEAASAGVQVRAVVTAPTPTPDARGVGLVLYDPDEHPDAFTAPPGFTWDEPNAPGTIAVALDSHNPPPTDREPTQDAEGNPRPPAGWFDEHGNWDDRPQRELSVHVDGVEVHNVRCPVEFRTGEPIELEASLTWTVGGALLGVTLDGQPVLDAHPLLGVRPVPLRAASGTADAVSTISAPRVAAAGVLDAGVSAKPVRVPVFAERFVHAGDRQPIESVDFSGVPERIARVIATLRLSEPEVGYDHWDKKGSVRLRVEDAPNGSIEVLRFITPFRKGWTWKADVTHLRPLFQGVREMECFIDTWMKGWLVSFDLDFYPGAPDPEPIAVVPLWSGDAEIGNPDNPPADFFTPRAVPVPPGATRARAFVTATGHGMLPNTDNAGEFMPLGRTLRATTPGGETAEHDVLWKDDVYLNPCRPQGGTWKFDRAGWAPGSVVPAWTVDLSGLLPAETLTVTYELDPYLNEGRGQTWAPHHWTDAVLVFYREPE